jgi:kinesin family protein 4/21/27
LVIPVVKLNNAILLTCNSPGVIPRSINFIFSKLNELQEGNPQFQYELKVSFLEIHNEELTDLLSQSADGKYNITIREDKQRGIYCTGLSEFIVETPEQLLEVLVHGSQFRKTASTFMNDESSRSHAIFTLHLKQVRWIPLSNISQAGADEGRWQNILSKFHFVDLAGSERVRDMKEETYVVSANEFFSSRKQWLLETGLKKGLLSMPLCLL